MRMNYQAAAPDVMTAMIGLETYLARQSRRDDGIDKPLMELVKIRVSQINRCAFCIDMHTRYARAIGETEQRIYALSAWRETPFFTERERAALAWAEAVTRIAGNPPPTRSGTLCARTSPTRKQSMSPTPRR